MRRGAFKPEQHSVDSIEHFDLIVRPEDSVAATRMNLSTPSQLNSFSHYFWPMSCCLEI